MKKYFISLFIVIAALCSIYFVWDYFYPSGTWRYKITVNVETPEGLKSGSAVREVTVMSGLELTPESTASKEVRGEAVVVDLGKRGVLFALLGTDDYQTLFQAFPVLGYGPGEAGTSDVGIRYYRSLKKTEPKVLPATLYPRLVTFKDISDPKTVVLAYNVQFGEAQNASGIGFHPVVTKIDDHFEELFGQGVSLKDITIEITDESVTKVIGGYLPWLNEINGGYLDGQTSGGGPELSNILHGGNFSRGAKE